MNFTDMIHGALGALAILTTLLVARTIGRLQLGTRLRNRYRRLIGMEHFERLTLDEIREFRREMEFYTRGLPSEYQLSTMRQSVQATGHKLQAHRDTLSAHATRVNRLKREVEENGILLRQYIETLGPIWNTAQGHRMPMRLLSTGHLTNIVEGGFGGLDARDFARTELERRRIDADWRERQSNGESAPTFNDYAMGRVKGDGSLMPPEILLPMETLARVSRVLPLWAQNIVTDLRTRRLSTISKSNRDKLDTLPLWAQTLIQDLLQQTKG